MAAKLKIAGAWSGVLEAELESWTVHMLREQIARRLDCGKDHIILICAGKVLKDDGWTQKKLIELGVKNNSKILATRVPRDQGKELIAEEEKSDRLQRLKAAAASLAKRHAEDLEDQRGEKVQLGSENDQRAMVMGLMFHGLAKRLVKSRKYEDALEVLAMGEEAFSLCASKVVEMIDNIPILQIDMVWCYFMLKDISKLSVAGKRLEEARKGIERCHGKGSTRLKLLQVQGNSHPELALHLRLELLEGIVAYHSGDFEKAKKSLTSARARYMQLQVSDEKVSLLISMGYDAQAAKRALRMNNQDVERAVNILVEEKAKKQQRIEDDIRRRNDLMEQKSYGVTPLRKPVDLQKLKELETIGFEKELAAESLRRNENETQKALGDLTNPETNSDIQLFIESRKKKRLRGASDAAVDHLTSLGFPRETVVAAVRAYGTEEQALSHLIGQDAPNESAQSAPTNVGSSSVAGQPGFGEAVPSTEADDGDLSQDSDVEMEEELLQGEDAFSYYDFELTTESEAIDEYLALVLQFRSSRRIKAHSSHIRQQQESLLTH